MKIILAATLMLFNIVLNAQTGNVGIGVSTPQSRLHVRTLSSGGTFHPNATAVLESNTINFLQFSNSVTASSGILSGTNLTQQRSSIFFNPDSSIRFTAGGTVNSMLLDNTGFLGINTTSPTSRLHVSNGASGNSSISSSRIATFEDNATAYIQLLNPNANESGILAGNASTLIKAGIVFAADSSISIRTGGNGTRIRVENEGSVIFNAPTTLPTLPTAPIASNGNRLVWWADKAALRVGGISNPPWSESSLGSWSLSAGYNTDAIGNYAVATGNGTQAVGDASFTTGINSITSGDYSFAGGNSSIASGIHSFAFGHTAKTGGSNSISVGFETVANGAYSFAIGNSDTASALYSGALGTESSAKGQSSFVIGTGLTAKPYGTIIVGSYNEISNLSSSSPSASAPVFVVGIGADNNTRKNGLEVYRDGTASVGNLDVNSFVTSNLTPSIDDFNKLGTSAKRWKEIWSANPFLQSSDVRLKTNIAPVRYGLQTVLAMKPVSYNMKSNMQSVELGFLAQDMEKLVPEVVVSPENDGLKAMKYSSLIPVLVQAIQDQQKTIEVLENRIKLLEKNSTK
jgi:hypothetical protein